MHWPWAASSRSALALLARACADDAALALADYWPEAPLLQRMFEKFASVSGLRLKQQKYVTAPPGLDASGIHGAGFKRQAPRSTELRVRARLRDETLRPPRDPTVKARVAFYNK